MDSKTPTAQKGNSQSPESALDKEFRGIVEDCSFFGTLPEYRDLNSIAEFTSIDIHPTKSLVVTGDIQDNIVVWDYESKNIIFRMSSNMVYEAASSYINQQSQDALIPSINLTNDSTQSPMTGLKSVQFYDNDTLLWSNNCSYTAVPSQYIIALFSEGFALIDYIAQTAVEVRSDLHLQGLVPTCVLPLNDRYLLVGTNGHLCVFDTVNNIIQTSVAHVNVLHLLPYKACEEGSIYYQHSTNEIQVIAINSANVGICWNIAIGSNNEFISIQPSFALADGGLCSGTINHAVYSLAMKKVYILSDNHTITTVDCTMTYLPAKYDGLTSLGCDKALPSSSLSSLTFTDTILDIAEPLIPALSSQFIPIVNNKSTLSVANLITKKCSPITTPSMLPEGLATSTRMTHIALRSSNHDHIATISNYGVSIFPINTTICPPSVVLPIAGPQSHILVYTNKHLYYQTVDLIEKPVGSSLFITQPAASIQSVEIGPDFTCDEVPSLLFNSDYSKLAVVFERNQVVQLFSVSLSSSTPSITSLSELTSITSFAWSYSPAKYATVEEGRLYITDMTQSSKVNVWIQGESEINRVTGGYFLGVYLNPTEAEIRSTHIHSEQIQFFGWDIQAPEGGGETTPTGENESTVNEWKKHEHLKVIGSRLPAPLQCFYCNDNASLLLAYRDKTAIYQIEKEIELITILNHSVISCYFICNSLFLLTPTSLLLMVINKKSTITYTLGHRTTLSTIPALQSTVYSNQVLYNTSSNPLLPPVYTLPTGMCRLLSLCKGSLLLATAASQIVAFPLNHPSLRFIMLIASGQVDLALAWTKKIQKDQHDAVAYILQSWGYIEKCLELPGLSPSLRLSFQLDREDVPSIIKIIKKGELHLFDEADNANVDYRLTPVDQLPGIRRATLLLAKAGKKEELKKLLKLCQKNDRDEDAEFVSLFLYKDDPSLLLATLKKENKYHDAALLSKMNTKYHSELPELVQAWNQQLKTEARSTSYLSGVEVVLEESAKRVNRKAKASTTTKTATKGKAAAKGEGRRGRRRRG